MENLLEEDRAQMLRVIDDDKKFDQWLEQWQRKKVARPSSGGSGKSVKVSKEEYFKNFGKQDNG